MKANGCLVDKMVLSFDLQAGENVDRFFRLTTSCVLKSKKALYISDMNAFPGESSVMRNVTVSFLNSLSWYCEVCLLCALHH